MHTTELIDSIRLLLDDRASNVSAEILALEYARQCREVNDRLAKIGLMLESGGEIQALQLAEQPPRVVEQALALSFGSEAAWQEFCRDHGHEVAALVDARTVEALLAIQDKGIAPNHPLYKDYRSAISKRDDEKAFDLIRVIARMNPGDQNAAKELKRFERKALQNALADLKSKLDSDDDIFLTAMTKVEETGLVENYETVPEWKHAKSRRTRIRRAAAFQRMPNALAEAEAELQDGDWRQAAVLYEEYASLAETYGLDAAEAESLDERAKKIKAGLDTHRGEAERVARSRQLVAEMERIAEDVETRIVTPQGLTRDFAEPRIEEMVRNRRELESLRGEFPENARRRVDTTHAQMVQALERARRTRRIRIVSGLAAAVILLLAGATYGAFALRAAAHVKHLASLRDQQSSVGLRELVTQIRDAEQLLLRFPALSAEVAMAGEWLRTMDAKQSLMEIEISTLEKQRMSDFSSMASTELFTKLRETGSLVTDLPTDMVGDAQMKLTLIRNEGERVLARRQQEHNAAALELTERWSAVLDKIDPQGPAEAAGKIIENAPADLEPYLKFADLEHPMLRLPASTSSVIADLDARISQMRERVAAVAACFTASESATTLAEYRDALSSLSSTTFSESASAQRVLDALPDDEWIKAILVFRGDLAALKASANDDPYAIPMPEAAVAGDREVISELASSEILNGLWEVEWQDSKGNVHHCLSLGELGRVGVTGRTGKLALYPKLAAMPLNFVEREMYPADGNTVLVNRPTATAAMMSDLALDKLLDDTGTRFRSSVLPLLDSVANNSTAHPLAKAHVYGRLLKLIQNHNPEAWGLHYCPDLIDDIRAFQDIAMTAPLSERSWLATDKDQFVNNWESYFCSQGSRSSFAQLRKTRRAASEALRNPLQLAGHVNAAGEITTSPASDERLILGIRVMDDGDHEFAVCGIINASGQWHPEQPVIAPFSPLVTLPLTPETREHLLSIHKPVIEASNQTGEP